MPDTDPIAPPSPCDDAADFADMIRDALAAPKRVRGEAGEVENHSVRDMIAADQYLKGQCAAERPHRGLRLTKLIPGSTA